MDKSKTKMTNNVILLILSPVPKDFYQLNIDGLVKDRRNSSALAMELRLTCTDPLIYDPHFVDIVSVA